MDNSFDTELAILGEGVAFGPGRIATLGAEVVARAGAKARVLLVADAGVAAAGLTVPAETSLANAGVTARIFTDVRSDPLAVQIDSAAQAARELDANMIVGLGGGSAVDVAKMAAGVASGSAPAESYALQCDPFGDGVLPVIAVPTTAGTGAEMTQSMVFTAESGAKVWADAGNLRPVLALLDPELTISLPAHLTAATGVDALVHAIESVTSHRTKSQTHTPALAAIRLIRRYLPTAVREPKNVEARSAMIIAATLAGRAIDSGGTTIGHALGHALGAIGHVHHGRSVALSLRVALPGNVEAAPGPHIDVARAFGVAGDSDADVAAALPSAFDAFLREVSLRIDVADSNLKPEDAERLAAEAMKPENDPMRKSNLRPIEQREMLTLARVLLAAS
ncbi:MAG: iron-containing alcohol dehydrogenase [Alphaproteobacteria bacterium]